MSVTPFTYSAWTLFGDNWPPRQPSSTHSSLEKRISLLKQSLGQDNAGFETFIEAVKGARWLEKSNKGLESSFPLIETIYSIALSKEPQGYFLTKFSHFAMSNYKIRGIWISFVNELICGALKRNKPTIVENIFSHVPTADPVVFVDIREALRWSGFHPTFNSLMPLFTLNPFLSAMLSQEEVTLLLQIRSNIIFP